MRFWLGLVVLGLAGCGPIVATETGSASQGDGGASTSSGSGATSTASTLTTVGSGPADTSTSASTGMTGSASAADFIVPPDIPPHYQCSLEEQDCAPGFKCMPYALESYGALWDATACFPVDPDPVGLGEPCEAELDEYGGWTGIDNCGWAAVCWDFDPEGPGICEGLCVVEDVARWAPCEDPDAIPDIPCQSCFCTCEVPCDPLAQDCPGDLMCVVTSDIATCIPDASEGGGQYGEGCEYVNVCAPGLACVQPDYVPGCEDETNGCCTPYCDTTNAMCPPTTHCEPYYERGMAPPNFENLGLCLL